MAPVPCRPHHVPRPGPCHPQKLTAPGARDFLFSEVGLGGGDASNQRAAASVAEVASNPLNGIWTVYNVKQDPWSKSDYKSYRREWFKCVGL